MKSGIYLIRCSATGKVYVGSARNIKERWKVHRYKLRHGKHVNKYLQRAWNKYGEGDFAFVVVELVADESLIERETFHIRDKRAAHRDTGFNILEIANSRAGLRHTEETRRKQSLAQKGRPVSPERRAAISAALTGRKLPPEVGRKVSLALKGRCKPDGFALAVSMAQAKFSAENVLELRRRSAGGESNRSLAREFHTSHKVVKNAICGIGPFYASIG